MLKRLTAIWKMTRFFFYLELTDLKFATLTDGKIRLQVQIPFWALADVVHGSPEFNFSAALVNSQLVCLLPVGILNVVMFIWIFVYHCLFILVLKSPNGTCNFLYLLAVTEKAVCALVTTAGVDTTVFLELVNWLVVVLGAIHVDCCEISVDLGGWDVTTMLILCATRQWRLCFFLSKRNEAKNLYDMAVTYCESDEYSGVIAHNNFLFKKNPFILQFFAGNRGMWRTSAFLTNAKRREDQRGLCKEVTSSLACIHWPRQQWHTPTLRLDATAL